MIRKFLKVIQSFLNFILNKFGLEIKRKFTNVDKRFKHFLWYKKINCIVDVGANDGEYGEYLRNIHYNDVIISLEPLSDAFEKLKIKSSKDNQWKVFNYAAGDIEKDEIINISKNSVSSSIHKINKHHLDAAPESQIVNKEKIKVIRLDEFLLTKVNEHNKIFLKIDTQGYEDRVLDGVKNMIEKIEGIRVEMSLKSLYIESLCFEELYKKITNMGFELWDLSPAFVDRKTARVLQLDAVFFKKINHNKNNQIL